MKLFKLLIFIAINAVIAFVLYTGYDLWRRDGQINQTSLESELKSNFAVVKQNATVIAAQTKEELTLLNDKLRDEYKKIDWQDVRKKLKMSNEDLSEYKEFTKWAFEEVSSIEGYDYEEFTKIEEGDDVTPGQAEKPKKETELIAAATPYSKKTSVEPSAKMTRESTTTAIKERQVATSVTPPSSRESEPIKTESKLSAGQRPAKTEKPKKQKNPTYISLVKKKNSAGQKETRDPEPEPEAKNSSSTAAGSGSLSANERKRRDMLAKAGKALAEAKKVNRGALPGKPNFKRNLKKSIKLYEKAENEYQKIMKSSHFSQTEKNQIEQTISGINKQIYWGKKFSTI